MHAEVCSSAGLKTWLKMLDLEAYTIALLRDAFTDEVMAKLAAALQPREKVSTV